MHDQRGVRGRAGSLVLTLCTLLACGDDDAAGSTAQGEASSGSGIDAVVESTTARAEQLASQRGRWDAADIDSYDFTIGYTTDIFHGTYRISVRHGVPVSAERLEPGDVSDNLGVSLLPKTIDSVFAQLERNVAASSFNVDFDHDLGYPTYVFIDRNENAVDDEREFFISDFARRPDED
jgi:hypothetical protein